MLGFGLTVAAIGMGIVFFELVLLIVVIKLITMGSRAITGRNGAQQPQQKPAPPAQAVVAAPAEIKAAEDDEDEIAAVIAAAVAYLTQGTAVITAIKRIQGTTGTAWSQAGRQETMSLRQ